MEKTGETSSPLIFLIPMVTCVSSTVTRVSLAFRTRLCATKRLKRLRKGSFLFVTNGRLCIKAFISTFMTCGVSWRHIGHSLNTQITKTRKLTRRFDIPQKQPTAYNKDLPLVRLSFGSFIDTRKKLRDSGIHL